VDDIILGGDNLNDMNKVNEFLNESFKMKGFDQLEFFLGVGDSLLNQRDTCLSKKCALNILVDFKMCAAKPCFTPMTTNVKQMFNKVESYLRMIGRLLY